MAPGEGSLAHPLSVMIRRLARVLDVAVGRFLIRDPRLTRVGQPRKDAIAVDLARCDLCSDCRSGAPLRARSRCRCRAVGAPMPLPDDSLSLPSLERLPDLVSSWKCGPAIGKDMVGLAEVAFFTDLAGYQRSEVSWTRT